MQEVRKVVITTVKGEMIKLKPLRRQPLESSKELKVNSSGNITSAAATPTVTRQRG